MPKDPGDEEFMGVESWEPDDEPEPSVIDSWADQCIKPIKIEPKVRKESVAAPKKIIPPKELEIVQSGPSTIASIEGESDYYYIPEYFFEEPPATILQEKSIFSLTLSMSQRLLLLDSGSSLKCNKFQSAPKKKKGNYK